MLRPRPRSPFGARSGLVPILALASTLAAAATLAWVARGDEMSGDDKLRLLYSHRFTFTRDGLPLYTIEIMSGQKQVRLSAKNGIRVLPDGEGGAEVVAGADWTVTVENAHPAKIRWWTIVSRTATDADAAAWKQRGYEVKTFETGVVFGVEGDVIDSRETYLGVAPENDEAAAKRAAAALAKKWQVATFVHPELAERPRGTLVAHDAKTGTEVRNASVIWFAPAKEDGDEASTITVKDVAYGGGGSQTGAAADKHETRSYFGRVYVTIGTDGALTVVNAVPEDRLLAGLVPSEIFPDAPPDALRAQAVAARDEILSRIGTRHFAEPFLLCSTQHCQVYGGQGPEDARTTKAVKETRGEVLLEGGGGGLVPAYYSASCGGFSENNESIWGTPPDPSLRGHLDALGDGAKALKPFAAGITDDNIKAFLASPPESAFCGRSKFAKGRYRWTVTKTARELDDLVAVEYPDVGAVRELVPGPRGVSGRIKSLGIVGAHGKATVDGDLHIRRLLGGLKSTLFMVHAEKAEGTVASWVFEGAGFGHGVGLCQTGAIGMAEGGISYKKILEHYYPGSRVRKLY